MATLVAFYDASVLYPAPLRDFLMRLALTGLFRARWSYMVHEEWISAVLRRRGDLNRSQLERTRRLMDAHARDSLVTGFEDLIEGIVLPDPGDRHVVAAAIRGHADVIVTRNLSDFPEERIARYGIEALHPDAFIGELLDQDPDAVLGAAHEHRASLKNPHKSAHEYLATLERQGLDASVSLLRERADSI